MRCAFPSLYLSSDTVSPGHRAFWNLFALLRQRIYFRLLQHVHHAVFDLLVAQGRAATAGRHFLESVNGVVEQGFQAFLRMWRPLRLASEFGGTQHAAAMTGAAHGVVYLFAGLGSAAALAL